MRQSLSLYVPLFGVGIQLIIMRVEIYPHRAPGVYECLNDSQHSLCTVCVFNQRGAVKNSAEVPASSHMLSSL